MKTIVVMPTYNEAENLPQMVAALLSLENDLEIVIVDDNSPDGTGDLAEKLSRQHPSKLHIIHREGKFGLGTAYVAGFRFALEKGADRIVEMDADFSHSPSYLPFMLEAIEGCDVVVGSRYAPGGRVEGGWGAWRRFLSWAGNLYARLITGLKVRDTTAGFKCFRKEVLQNLELARIGSDGYAFQIEIAYLCQRKGFKVREIPIVFQDRAAGSSKMSLEIVCEAVWRVPQLRLKYR